ncbi:MAG: lipid-A-disaccharide synthase [Bacteroidetes bacterium]|nr:lipid-A-disaccharide synthase [Bacteroidota bacterium]
MKYYVIAGEASGDLHASNLIKELKNIDNTSIFRCWGGDLMKEQGVELVKHYRSLAFMGFVEVIANLKTILNNISFCKKDIAAFQPDAIILIDYPGFNLRIAEWAHENGIKVFYYISPQVWAWHQSRVKKMKKVIDHLFVILPFEKDFFKSHAMEVDFVGHPLLDAIENHSIEKANANNINVFEANDYSEKPIIALLPGSRNQEVKTMLPLMIELTKAYPQYKFIIAGVNTLQESLYLNIIKNEAIEIVYGQTYNLLKNAFAALVTSGTATLETALLNVPQVVCYKGNIISYYIARRFLKVKYISLVNLIMDKLVITELIQNEFNIHNLKNEFEEITQNNLFRNQLKEEYQKLKIILGGKGASAKTAQLIVEYMNKN